jgi:hypothetical protein
MKNLIEDEKFVKGQYAGETVQDVWDDDPDYVDWLISKDAEDVTLTHEDRIFLEEIYQQKFLT